MKIIFFFFFFKDCLDRSAEGISVPMAVRQLRLKTGFLGVGAGCTCRENPKQCHTMFLDVKMASLLWATFSVTAIARNAIHK